LALGFVALVAWGSAPGAANAGTYENGAAPNSLSQNGILENGVHDNGMVPGVATKFATFQAVRLTLPDGSEVSFH
jgi:hypothetical protein